MNTDTSIHTTVREGPQSFELWQQSHKLSVIPPVYKTFSRLGISSSSYIRNQVNFCRIICPCVLLAEVTPIHQQNFLLAHKSTGQQIIPYSHSEYIFTPHQRITHLSSSLSFSSPSSFSISFSSVWKTSATFSPVFDEHSR